MYKHSVPVEFSGVLVAVIALGTAYPLALNLSNIEKRGQELFLESNEDKLYGSNDECIFGFFISSNDECIFLVFISFVKVDLPLPVCIIC